MCYRIRDISGLILCTTMTTKDIETVFDKKDDVIDIEDLSKEMWDDLRQEKIYHTQEALESVTHYFHD